MPLASNVVWKLISALTSWRTLCLVLAMAIIPGAAASTCTDTPSCVIDLRWPMTSQFPQGQRVTHVYVVRVIPGQSVDPEAYVVIRLLEDGAIEADYSSPDGDSLFAQIRAMSGENLTRDELAKRLKTRTVHLANSKTLRDHIGRLRKICVGVGLPSSLYLDATRYDISEVTPMNTLMLSIYDSEIDKKNELLEWAKSLITACRAGRLSK